SRSRPRSCSRWPCSTRSITWKERSSSIACRASSATSTGRAAASSHARDGRAAAGTARFRSEFPLSGWRIVFMGTPPFAAPILAALLDRADPVVGVVCQPDRPRGRGLVRSPPPIKEIASARGLPVLQPERLRDAAFEDALGALAPDLIVVAAYGKIL